MQTKEKGDLGEDEAAEYCKSKGYNILERQYRNRYGEIDLICRDGDTIVFIEVKSWSTLDEDSLEYSIGHIKKKRIYHLAEKFLMEHPQYDSLYKRFDLIFLSWRTKALSHITDAF